MPPTWRGRQVVLTWELRFTIPRLEWVARLHAEIAASDAACEPERKLASRLNALALEVGACVVLELDVARQLAFSIRLVAPRITYLRSAQPRRVVGPALIELVGGTCSGERTELADLTDAYDCGHGMYVRSFHCAIDGAVRYVATPERD